MCVCVFVYVCERGERHLRETRLNKENEVSGSNATVCKTKCSIPFCLPPIVHHVHPQRRMVRINRPGIRPFPGQKDPSQTADVVVGGQLEVGVFFSNGAQGGRSRVQIRHAVPFNHAPKRGWGIGSREESREMSLLDCVKYLYVRRGTYRRQGSPRVSLQTTPSYSLELTARTR
jgi:hypothetical protein